MRTTELNEAREAIPSMRGLGRKKAECGCEICNRTREMLRISALLPRAEAAKLLGLYEVMFSEAEEADMEISFLRDKTEAIGAKNL